MVEGAAEGEEGVFSCVMIIDYVRSTNEKTFQVNLYKLFFFFLFLSRKENKKKIARRMKTDSLNRLYFSVANSSLHALPRRAAYDLRSLCQSISRYVVTLLSGKHGFPNFDVAWICIPRNERFLQGSQEGHHQERG